VRVCVRVCVRAREGERTRSYQYNVNESWHTCEVNESRHTYQLTHCDTSKCSWIRNIQPRVDDPFPRALTQVSIHGERTIFLDSWRMNKFPYTSSDHTVVLHFLGASHNV